MHGIAITAFKEFVTDAYGDDAWVAVQSAVGLEPRLYVPVSDYPDVDVRDLVSAASERSGQPVPDVYERYGRSMTPELLDLFSVLVDPEWDGVDLLANAEECVAAALETRKLSGYDAPDVDAEREGPHRVRLSYAGNAEFCPFARGLIEGVADCYGTTFDVDERSCQGEDDDVCEFVVERAGTPDGEGEAESAGAPLSGGPTTGP